MLRKKGYSVLLLGVFVLGLGISLCARVVRQEQARILPPSSDAKSSSPAAPARVDGAYGKLPLNFEANQGQADGQVKFLSRGPGYSLFLTPTEAVLTLRKEGQGPEVKCQGLEKADPKLETRNAKPETIRMKLIGSNRHPHTVGLGELPGKANYFIGNDSKKWRTNIPTYAKVKYEQVYAGVDLVYYGNQRQLEYDFVVAPGANPKVIKLAFEGADKVQVNTEGNLILHTEGGEVIQRAPTIYQDINGSRQAIPGRYVLLETKNSKLEARNPKSKTHWVGFRVGAYDAARPLVIDPVLSYSMYLGGSGNDQGLGIAVDADGNAYVTGVTGSTNFPTTEGAFQTASGGGSDAFVTKLNPEGSGLVYSTYLGGQGLDVAIGIALDAAGNAYVAGYTNSPDFPTTEGAFQTTIGGGRDAFVTKLNPEGSDLVYSTYLGGSGNEGFFAGGVGIGIAVDAEGNAYVRGDTTSLDFPTTEGAFQTKHGGGLEDAFVTKLNGESGKEATLLPPPPLRTARKSFPLCRSSLSNAGCPTRLYHGQSLAMYLPMTIRV